MYQTLTVRRYQMLHQSISNTTLHIIISDIITIHHPHLDWKQALDLIITRFKTCSPEGILSIWSKRSKVRDCSPIHVPKNFTCPCTNLSQLGVLVQCDESIKAIIEKLDKDHGHVYILESLDDTTLLCAAGKILELKAKLKEVCCSYLCRSMSRLVFCMVTKCSS